MTKKELERLRGKFDRLVEALDDVHSLIADIKDGRRGNYGAATTEQVTETCARLRKAIQVIYFDLEDVPSGWGRQFNPNWDEIKGDSDE